MVLAIAALLFQITPTVQHLDVSAVVPVAAAVSASANSSQPSTQPKANVVGVNSDGSNGTASNSLPDSPAATALRNSAVFSTFRIPEAQPIKQYRIISVEKMPSRRNWIILSIAQHSAATFDAYSTRQAVQSGAREVDPLMRPFANSPGIYAAIQAGPVVLDLIAHHMQRSQNTFLRRTWWLPQTASTGLFIFSGVHNLHVANNHP